MITVSLEEVVRHWCDVCGREVTNEGRSGNWDKTFCHRTFHDVLVKDIRCEELYKIKLQIESADIGF